MEPRRRGPARRAAARRSRRTSTSLAWLDAERSLDDDLLDRLYVPRNDPRWLRAQRDRRARERRRRRARRRARRCAGTPTATTSCSPSTHAGRSPGWRADAAEGPRTLDLARPPDRVPVRRRRGRVRRATRPGWEPWAWVTTAAFVVGSCRVLRCSPAPSLGARHPFAQSLVAQIFDTVIVTSLRDGLRLRARPPRPADPLHRPRRGLRAVRDHRRSDPRRGLGADPRRVRRTCASTTCTRPTPGSSSCFQTGLEVLMALIVGWLVQRLAEEGSQAEARAEEAERLHEAERRTVEELRRLSTPAGRLRLARLARGAHADGRRDRLGADAPAALARPHDRAARRLPRPDRGRDRPSRRARRGGARHLADRLRHVQLHLRRGRPRGARQRDGRRRGARPRVGPRSPRASRPTCPIVRGDSGAAASGAHEPDRQRGQVLARRGSRRGPGGGRQRACHDRGRRPRQRDRSRGPAADLREVRSRSTAPLEAGNGARPLHRPRDRRGARRHARGQLGPRATARRSRSTLPIRQTTSRRGRAAEASCAALAQAALELARARRDELAQLGRLEHDRLAAEREHLADEPVARSRPAAPRAQRRRRAARAPFSTSQRPTAGEYQMRAVVACVQLATGRSPRAA